VLQIPQHAPTDVKPNETGKEILSFLGTYKKNWKN
jgi:hypothetical protein